MRTITFALVVSSLALFTYGCRRDARVDEGLGREEFAAETQQRIAQLEARLDAVQQSMEGRDQTVVSRVEASSDQAEQHISNIREMELQRLMRAANEDEADNVKESINDSLAAADEAISDAENTLEDAMAEPERFVLDARRRINELDVRRQSLEQSADRLEGPQQVEVAQAADNAEASLRQANQSLEQYQQLPEAHADEMQDQIDNLLSQAEDQLEQGEDRLQQFAGR